MTCGQTHARVSTHVLKILILYVGVYSDRAGKKKEKKSQKEEKKVTLGRAQRRTIATQNHRPRVLFLSARTDPCRDFPLYVYCIHYNHSFLQNYKLVFWCGKKTKRNKKHIAVSIILLGVTLLYSTNNNKQLPRIRRRYRKKVYNTFDDFF